jgi:diamine N-acetyltransferase
MDLNQELIKVELRPITKDNWLECANLKTGPEQENFVAQNIYSIAQSMFEPERVALAVYNQNSTMVGFVMFNKKPLSDGTFRISRLMIDSKHQGKGYGYEVAKLILQRLSLIKECSEVTVEISSENKIVQFAAEKLGFTFVDSNGTQRIAKFKI